MRSKWAGIVFIGGLVILAVAGGWWISVNIERLNNLPVPKTEVVVKTDEYLVTRVIDGDTIELESGQKVRYIGIDTPETVDPRKKVQCFGKEASDKNKELVLDKKVRLEKDVKDTDVYGRLLRYVYVNGEMVNLKLVEEGYAKADTVPPDIKNKDLFLQAERTARINNLGLWNSCQ